MSSESGLRHAGGRARAHVTGNAVLAGAIVLALCACLAVALVLHASYRDALTRAERADQNLALAIEQMLVRNFALYDAPLRTIRDNPDVFSDPDKRLPSSRLATFARGTLPKEVLSVFTLNEKGEMVANLFTPVPWQTDRTDRDYFQVQRADKQRGLFIGGPYLSRLSGIDAIALSERLNRPDGSFAGVVVSTVDLSYFSQMLASVKAGRLSQMSLLREDGTVLASFPEQHAFADAAQLAVPDFARIQQSRTGSFSARSDFDGTQRLYSFRHVGNFPLVFVVGHSTAEIVSTWRERAIEAATATFISASVLILVGLWFRRSQRQLARLSGLLAPRALIDPLTQLPDGRCLISLLPAEIRQARENGQPLTLLMIDIDFMRRYNKRYGYAAGDAALLAVAACCRDTARGAPARDFVARLNRSSFVVMLVNTAVDEGRRIAGQLRHDVVRERIRHAASDYGVLSVSIGVATLTDAMDAGGDALVAAGGVALYQAKQSGHNQVHTFLGQLTRAETAA